MSKSAAARKRALEVLDILRQSYPDARCALDYRNPFELLVATILSAQCTDVRVNLVTPELFSAYPDAPSLAGAESEELEALVRTTGFYRNKAANLRECARTLVSRHGGEVPEAMEDLVELPGVGRKTANVIRGNVFGKPAMVVDTHVKRISYRLGWTKQTQPEKIEEELCRLLPKEHWTEAGHLLIAHGRTLCKAPLPHCGRCPVLPLCPRAGVQRAL